MPLPLRKDLRGTHGIVAIFQTGDRIFKTSQSCCRLHLFFRDSPIIQCDLLTHRTRHHMERLLHIAKQRSPFLFRNFCSRNITDPYASTLRLIQTKQQLQDRTLSGTGTPGQCDLFAFFHLKTHTFQNQMFVIAKDYIFKGYRGLISGICRMYLICCNLFFLFNDIFCYFPDTLSFSVRSVCFSCFQIEKLIDSVNTCHR